LFVETGHRKVLTVRHVGFKRNFAPGHGPGVVFEGRTVLCTIVKSACRPREFGHNYFLIESDELNCLVQSQSRGR
jgi:hypothetical protein